MRTIGKVVHKHFLKNMVSVLQYIGLYNHNSSLYFLFNIFRNLICYYS